MQDITILGIDPGTTTLGIAIFHLNNKLEIVSIDTSCINSRNAKTGFRENTNLEYRLHAIGIEVETFILKYKPIAIAIEMPFINPKRITSVIPLARLLGILMDKSIDNNPYRLIYRKSPSEVKNAIGAKGNADKDSVLEAMLRLDEITNLIDLKAVTDHEVDACAVNYGLLKSLRTCYLLPIL